MNNNSTRKSTILAIACFVALGIFAKHTANAQNDTTATSPLLTTTGPSVLGTGRIMWSADINEFYFRSNSYTNNIIGGNTGLRWGIGSKAELTLGISATHGSGSYDTITIPDNNLTLTPSVGARLQLLESKDRQTQLTFFTDITFPIRQGQLFESYNEKLAEPIIGLQLRRKVWLFWVDASLGYAWNQHAPYLRSIDEPFRYSIFIRWLSGERHLVSIGWENHQGHLESMWQLNDKLQFRAQLNFAAGIGDNGWIVNPYGLVGFNWIIR